MFSGQTSPTPNGSVGLIAPNLIENKVQAIHEVINHLEQRIEPVLGGSVPTTNDASPSSDVPVLRGLDDIQNHLEHLVNRLGI